MCMIVYMFMYTHNVHIYVYIYICMYLYIYIHLLYTLYILLYQFTGTCLQLIHNRFLHREIMKPHVGDFSSLFHGSRVMAEFSNHQKCRTLSKTQPNSPSKHYQKKNKHYSIQTPAKNGNPKTIHPWILSLDLLHPSHGTLHRQFPSTPWISAHQLSHFCACRDGVPAGAGERGGT